MRKEGGRFLLRGWGSFSTTRGRLKNSGKRGFSVVRGDRSKDGIFSSWLIALMLEGDVGKAKKERSFSGCS